MSVRIRLWVVPDSRPLFHLLCFYVLLHVLLCPSQQPQFFHHYSNLLETIWSTLLFAQLFSLICGDSQLGGVHQPASSRLIE